MKGKPRKSKRPSRSESSSSDELISALGVGSQRALGLQPKDEALFRAFQSNLLSLISHELRTPLTGILNALNLLDDPEAGGEFSAAELISMARRNAQRLHQTLSSLLDLAALESGTFNVRLKEIDLRRLVRLRLDAHESLFEDRELVVHFRDPVAGEGYRAPILADPQKLGRALDLGFQILIPRAKRTSEVEVRLQASSVVVIFEMTPDEMGEWKEVWLQAAAGAEAGVASPLSAFYGTLQSEEGFLSRTREGLGSELLLIHEILRRHQGRFSQSVSAEKVTFRFDLPELSSEEALLAVVASRVYQTSTGLHSVAVALTAVPDGQDVDAFRAQIKQSLFRTSDAVYALPSRRQVAVVMDDCPPEDVPRLMARIEKAVGQPLEYGVAACPEETTDPEILLRLAEKRLEERLRLLSN